MHNELILAGFGGQGVLPLAQGAVLLLELGHRADQFVEAAFQALQFLFQWRFRSLLGHGRIMGLRGRHGQRAEPARGAGAGLRYRPDAPRQDPGSRDAGYLR